MDPTRVLIVDDEVELVNALEVRLGLRGFIAEGVFSGEVALKRLAEETFDVVLLDMRMPGMDGLEVIRRVRQVQPSVEVVLVTGHGSRKSAEEGIALGAFDYLMKPVKITTLLQVVNAAAERKRERQKKR
jgi:DNA-binding NtrC family response regulator